MIGRRRDQTGDRAGDGAGDRAGGAAEGWLAAKLRAARFSLWAERVVRAFWPLYALVAGFLAAAYLGALANLPYLPHLAVLAAVAGAALWFGWRGARALRAPTGAEARARLDGDAADRPATALADTISAGSADPAARAIWAAHLARMAERAAALRRPTPDLRLSDRDPWALRYMAPLALIGAAFLAAGDGGARLEAALTPSAGSAAPAAPALSIEAWATPPVYTGAPPVYLTEIAAADLAGPVALPVGSVVSIRVYDSEAAPVLAETVGDPAAPAAFADDGGRGHQAEIAVKRAGEVAVTLGEQTAAAWRLTAIADAPPTIALTAEPGPDGARALEIAFSAADDYGVAAAWARIEPDMAALAGLEPARPFVDGPLEVALPLPLTGLATEAAETVAEDLSEHVWAGLPVTLTLFAEDEPGQRGGSETVRLTLPGRRFFDPMARALVEQRQSLAWDLDRAAFVLASLNAITAYPETAFQDEKAYLIVRTAIRRLGYAIDDARLEAEAGGVIELLWRAALLIEDGDLSSAAERLRAAQRNLREALRDGASDEELAALMQELREALNEFLNQMAQQALQDPGSLAEMPPDAQMLDQQTLQDLLDQLENAARGGLREQAEQLLSQLQQMLENLQMARPGQGQGQGQGQQALQDLQDMIGRQQGLADETFDMLQQQRRGMQLGPQSGGQPQTGPQTGRQGQRGEGQAGQGLGGEGSDGADGEHRADPEGAPGAGGLAERQETLRRLLEDLRSGLPPGLGDGAAEALDRADGAMGAARDDLNAEDPGSAVDRQVEALDALRDGAEALGEALRELARQTGRGQGGQALDGPAGDAPELDPLGRPQANDGPVYGDSVTVPDESELSRSRELLDELRRRSGERQRPEPELDYLDRLIDPF